MDKNTLVISDIHGCLEEFNMLLNHSWNPATTNLYILGDLIDRGPHSKGVVQKAKHLVEEYGATVLKGNHEKMFIDFLNDPYFEAELYMRNGGDSTIDDFVGRFIDFEDIELVAQEILTDFPEEINFINNLPLYATHGDYLFVHAGVNPHLANWEKNDEHDLLWIREEFHYQPNPTNKTIIFGHTPTKYLNNTKDGDNYDVWVSPCGTKIGIDGAVAMEGVIHGLLLNQDGSVDVHTLDPLMENSITITRLSEGK